MMTDNIRIGVLSSFSGPCGTSPAKVSGKQDVHHLEKEDLVALTVEAAAMADVPLAGTNWVPGR